MPLSQEEYKRLNSNLKEAASFFLERAFESLNGALSSERARIIYETTTGDTSPQPSWEDLHSLEEHEAMKVFQHLHSIIPQFLVEGPKLDKSFEIKAVGLAGFFTDLHACVETVMNRTLYCLKHDGSIDSETYKALDSANLLPKLLFVFKSQFKSGELSLSKFRLLNSKRNKAVHYRANSRSEISLEFKEVFSLGREVAKLLDVAGGEPTSDDVFAELDKLERYFLPSES